MWYSIFVNNELQASLKQKSGEVLSAILIFLSNKDKEITFELFEEKFPDIQGKRLGSLFSGVARSLVNGKRITISVPQFGSRRKVWKLNKDLSENELEELEATVKAVLEERK